MAEVDLKYENKFERMAAEQIEKEKKELEEVFKVGAHREIAILESQIAKELRAIQEYNARAEWEKRHSFSGDKGQW